MARKMDNPKVVNELIKNLWNVNFSQAKFEKLYASLSSRDMDIVCKAINNMDKVAEKNLLKDCLW